MPPAQSELVDRVRTKLSGEPIRREIAMFGGWAFMVNEKMTVSAGKTGDLLVRVNAADHNRLLQKPGAHQPEMGGGKPMSPGWITVTAEYLYDDDALNYWLSTALEHNSSLTSAQSHNAPDRSARTDLLD